MPRKSATIYALLAMILVASPASAQSGSDSGTSTLNLTVGSEAGLTVATTSSLTSSGTNLSNYSGSTALTYYIRTSQTTGAGSITAKVTADFTPALGPSVASPPTTGDALTYSSSGTIPGNNGAGAVMAFIGLAASTTSQTNVATFAADNRSLITGNSEIVAWKLTNDPKYRTGAYSATVTFTISAT